VYKRDIRGDCRCGNQQIECAPPARLASPRRHRGMDQAERACDIRVDRQRIERGLGPLQSILPTGAFRGVGGRVRPGGEFGQG